MFGTDESAAQETGPPQAHREDTAADVTSVVTALHNNMAAVVLGKDAVVRKCLVALLAGEHVLLEDVPGVGKTLVGKALAKSVAGSFCRVQFTPDLLPSDIVGSSVYHANSGEFSYNRGPIFANIVLADEINRAPPRTQSALLEAMSDNQVSVDGQTHQLPEPFMVIATQNPFEFEGTYPLPESQLDRFLLRISMGYPDRTRERRILATHREGEPVNELKSVVSCAEVLRLQRAVLHIRVDDSIEDRILDIVEATRHHEELHVGGSTRAAICMYRAAQATALIHGRDYVVPDDVKGICVALLAHRVIPKGYAHGGQRVAIESLIERSVEECRLPD